MQPKKSYRTTWDLDGTCYRQRITIDRKTYDYLKDCLQAERLKNNGDYYYNLYLKHELVNIDNCIFLNLTQRDFFNRFLKLKLSDLNTYLLLKY